MDYGTKAAADYIPMKHPIFIYHVKKGRVPFRVVAGRKLYAKEDLDAFRTLWLAELRPEWKRDTPVNDNKKGHA